MYVNLFVKLRVVAEVGDEAGAAAWFARDADVAAVQDKPVVRVQQVFGRHARHQPFFDGKYGFARRNAGAVGNAKDVGIDRHYWLTEGGVQDDVRGFATNAGEFFQRGAVGRHCAAVFVEKDLAGFQDVYGFGVVETDGFNVVLQAVFAEGEEGGGGVGDGKEAARGFVHAFVGRLRREDDGDEQLEGARVFELGGRLRVGVTKAAEAFSDGGGGHAVCRCAQAMAVAIAARDCGLFFQQLLPVSIAPSDSTSSMSALASASTSSSPICARRCSTVLPMPFSASSAVCCSVVKGISEFQKSGARFLW